MLEERILKIIKNNLGTNQDLKSDHNIDDLKMDSISFIKIVVNLEGEFDFEFDDEMLLITKFPTIKTMIEYVEEKTRA